MVNKSGLETASDIEDNTKVCKRCGWNWKLLVEKPSVCPKCKSYYWNIERKR